MGKGWGVHSRCNYVTFTYLGYNDVEVTFNMVSFLARIWRRLTRKTPAALTVDDVDLQVILTTKILRQHEEEAFRERCGE